jgi:outer membrane protein TolC
MRHLPLVLLLALPTAARAESLLPPDPVLAGYLADALHGNLGLRQRRLSVDEARAALAQVRAQWLPTLNLEARASERWGAVLDLGQLVNPAYAALNQLVGRPAFPTDLEVALPLKRETKLVATQPLFAPALYFASGVRQEELAVEQARWQGVARQLRAEVQTAYYQHGRVRAVVELLDQTRALLEENLRVSQLLLANGKATEDAVHRARAELSELIQRREEADAGVEATRRYLNFLTGNPLDAPVPRPPVPAAVSLRPLDSRGSAREELVALAAGRRAAGHAARLAKSAYLPTLALAGEYGFQGDSYDFSLDRDYLVVSLVLRWNLFGGGGDRARVRQAQLVGERLATQDQELRRQIDLQVRQAWRAADTVRRAIDASADRVESTRASYALVSRRYAAGAAPPVELLDARTALTRAEVDRISSRYELAIKLVELERVAALAPEVTP